MDGRYKIRKSLLFDSFCCSNCLSPPCLCQVLSLYWLLVCCNWIFWHLPHGMCSLMLIKMSPGAPARGSAPGELPSNTPLTCTKKAGLPESSLILSIFRDISDGPCPRHGLNKDCADRARDVCTWGVFTRITLKIDWTIVDVVVVINCRY